MDHPGSCPPNACISQTQLEQRDLIQYECNLAACYEAEYLLSLKIQEEMCHQKDAYDDPSEVSCQFNPPATTSTTHLNSVHFTPEIAMDFSNGDRGGQFLPGFLNNYSSESGLRVEHLAANICGQEQPHFTHKPGADNMSNTSLFSGPNECGASVSVSEDHLMHHDGPSRKKVCLNRADY